MKNVNSKGENLAPSYFISSKGKYAVVVFSGVLDNSSIPIFEKIKGELKSNEKACYYIYCFAAVLRFSPKAIREITNLQMFIRERGFIVRVCGFTWKDQKDLLESGAIRKAEVKKNIAQAIKGLIKAKRIKEKKKIV